MREYSRHSPDLIGVEISIVDGWCIHIVARQSAFVPAPAVAEARYAVGVLGAKVAEKIHACDFEVWEGHHMGDTVVW